MKLNAEVMMKLALGLTTATACVACQKTGKSSYDAPKDAAVDETIDMSIIRPDWGHEEQSGPPHIIPPEPEPETPQDTTEGDPCPFCGMG